MSANPFVYDAADYRRDYNILKTTYEGYAHFLSRSTGDDFDQCLEYTKKTISPNGKLGMKDPAVRMLHRDEGTDRERGSTTFTGYLKHVQDKQLLMAPTMTVYEREERNPSIISDYIMDRIAERKVYKQEKFDAGQRGDTIAKTIADSQQNSCKIDVNALSGAHNNKHGILFIRSAHSTLTSTCRSATAYANANNEKFLMGNRHYWSPNIVYNNIATICMIADLEEVDAVVQAYGLVYPCAEQAMQVVERGVEKYWSSDIHMEKIYRYLKGLTPVERAAFVYIGDLYHLAIFNPDVVRNLIGDFFMGAVEVETSVEDAREVLEKLDDDTKVWLSVVEQDHFRGKKYDEEIVNGPDELVLHLATVLGRFKIALDRYTPLIRGLWATKVAPASVAAFPSSIRRSVLAGDTDSTIFTVEWWVNWFLGEVSFSKDAYRVSATVVYFTSQMVIHLLAMMSANMGVSEKHLFRLSMKNEFCFPVFVPTNRSKHYFAYQLAQEGNVFKEMALELKGAELRNAATPPEVKKVQIRWIKRILDEIQDGGVDMEDKLNFVAWMEHTIRDDIKNNGHKWFRTQQIKVPETYTDPEKSVYRWYGMWNEVFGPKYGEVEAPPYMAVCFKVQAKTKTDINEWLESIEDLGVKKRLANWLNRKGVTQMAQILLPIPILESTGVPQELVQGANMNKVLYSIMAPFYVALETLGFYYPHKPFIQLEANRRSKEETQAYYDKYPEKLKRYFESEEADEKLVTLMENVEEDEDEEVEEQ